LINNTDIFVELIEDTEDISNSNVQTLSQPDDGTNPSEDFDRDLIINHVNDLTSRGKRNAGRTYCERLYNNNCRRHSCDRIYIETPVSRRGRLPSIGHLPSERLLINDIIMAACVGTIQPMNGEVNAIHDTVSLCIIWEYIKV
jgi:hypothetical protein